MDCLTQYTLQLLLVREGLRVSADGKNTNTSELKYENWVNIFILEVRTTCY